MADESTVRFFNSADKSTIDVHFKWMEEYGLDGVFMQHFFGAAQPQARKKPSTDVIRYAFDAASSNNRAIAIIFWHALCCIVFCKI